MSHRLQRFLRAVVLVPLALMLGGCHVDMWRQPKLIAQHESGFFKDGSASQVPVRNTIARGNLREDEGFYTGSVGGQLLTKPPIPVTPAALKRGREQYGIHCAPCHGNLGYGNGMIAQRGLAMRRQPGNYHTDRLRGMPIGYFYNVMTYGSGVMFSAAGRVTPRDRWNIAMYIRVLQLSQYAPAAGLSPEERAKLNPESQTPDTAKPREAPNR
jgi:mono/diheme cytochrome c family protein